MNEEMLSKTILERLDVYKPGYTSKEPLGARTVLTRVLPSIRQYCDLKVGEMYLIGNEAYRSPHQTYVMSCYQVTNFKGNALSLVEFIDASLYESHNDQLAFDMLFLGKDNGSKFEHYKTVFPTAGLFLGWAAEFSAKILFPIFLSGKTNIGVSHWKITRFQEK